MIFLTAIDPGPTESAFVRVEFNGDPRNIKLVEFGKRANADIFNLFYFHPDCDVLVIEKIASFGMAVGQTVFETVYESGRFAQCAMHCNIPRVDRITRHQVKIQICKSAKANDSNIRQALIDRWGGPESIKKGGPLYKVSKDCWAALAVACTWCELEGKGAA